MLAVYIYQSDVFHCIELGLAMALSTIAAEDCFRKALLAIYQSLPKICEDGALEGLSTELHRHGKFFLVARSKHFNQFQETR